MNRILAALCATITTALCATIDLPDPVRAQTISAAPQQVVVGCAYNSSLPTLASATFGFAQCDSTGHLLISGSFSATLSGFAPGGNYATLSASTTTGNVALPGGSVVVVYNSGSNAAYVKLGTSNAVTATSSNDYIPAGGALALTVGSNTYLAAITGSSTTTLNISGGSGLPTGWGGASGGGGSNAAAGATGSAVPSSGSYNALNVSGTLRGQTGANPSGSVYVAQNDVTSWAGTTLAAPSNYGTAPSGVVPGFNAYVTNNINAVQSGSWSVTVTGTPGVNASVTNAGATNPTSTLTRPANTTAYASGQLIASSTTAGSIVVPSFAIANSAGSAIIPLVRLATSATTGWGVTLTMTLWTGAPTYTNGDGGTYAVATSNGGKYQLGIFSCTLTQYADGAAGVCAPNTGNFAQVTLASGTAVYWDLQSTSAITPISGQTFTATAEVIN